MERIPVSHLSFCLGYWLGGAATAVLDAPPHDHYRAPLHKARAIRLHALAAGAVLELVGRATVNHLVEGVALCGKDIQAEWPDAVLRRASPEQVAAAAAELSVWN